MYKRQAWNTLPMPNIHFPASLFPHILSEYKPFVLLGSTTYLLLDVYKRQAFEGAEISCGMRGASGAVEHVTLSGSRLNLSVIDTDTDVYKRQV